MSEVNEPNPFKSPESGLPADKREATVSKMGVWGTGLASLVLITFLLWLAVGLGIVVALILIPAQLRAIVRYQRSLDEQGNWPSPEQQVQIFMVSVLICIPVLLAGVIGFGVVCFGGAMIAIAVVPPSQADPYRIGTMLWGGVPIGLLVGLVVYGAMWWWSLGTRSDQPQKELPAREPEEP